MKNIVIVGATSAIAEEFAKLYAYESANLHLLARDQEKLSRIQNDLLIRGASNVEVREFDARDFDSHQYIIENSFQELGKVDVFLVAFGSLPNQAHCQNDSFEALKEININSIGVISVLTYAANLIEKQKTGNITVITSVAGDRGRQSNYVYGAAKSMVSTFLQGLSQRLSKEGIHVIDIKPGFVDTPMTAELHKNVLWEKPENVAKIIKNRIEKKSNFSYVPFFWFFIMCIIKKIPLTIFNRIRL